MGEVVEIIHKEERVVNGADWGREQGRRECNGMYCDKARDAEGQMVDFTAIIEMDMLIEHVIQEE